MKSRMLSQMNYKDDSPSEGAQLRVETLRLLDMKLTACFNANMKNSPDADYFPRIVIYLGDVEQQAVMDLAANCPDICDWETYRGFRVVRVMAGSHMNVFCLNPPKRLI